MNESNIRVIESISPFHQQAADAGEYVLVERSADADRHPPARRPEGPSENAD
jgi:hypothetical protein